LALLDLIGLDTAHEILGVMYRQTGDRMYVAAPLLGQLVTARWLGRKAGKGFYTYQAPGSGSLVDDEHTPAANPAAPKARRVGLIGSGDQVKAVQTVLDAAPVEVRRESTDADCDLVVAAAAGVPVLKLAVAAGRRTGVVGLNVPSPHSGVVQVVRMLDTPAPVVEAAAGLCRVAGRTPVTCADRAGLIVDALLLPY
ncbi:MAG: 3-hydroxyacyl-CoA dehydrogenase family protein, partial [Alphaproteobacteria bacterium]|nr:3-hydroxyacyl-CoA dehydrogenase family protein [Alphaproteobacteria bacterium]